MRHSSGVLVMLLLLASLSQAFAQTKRSPADRARSQVARLGVGSKATATIKLNDGTRVKGYVYSAGDDDFV
ncbi:MAG TPA: hypothetical protein VKD91_24055, partial [Pyrinomonadaceae bacterium]|nr:hypothetical protein [Pyrinomonadaceae bacterium]